MRGHSIVNFRAMCSMKPLRIPCIAMLLLTVLLTGCGGVPMAYYYERPSGDRFYETTSEKVEQIMEKEQVLWEGPVPVILWVTTKGEVVDMTAAVGTTNFIQAKEFPFRENSEEQSRLLWGLRDIERDNFVGPRDISSFMVKKVSWDAVKQDWDLSSFGLAPETGRCKPLTHATLMSNPFVETLSSETLSSGALSKDPYMKRHNCLNLAPEIIAKTLRIIGEGYFMLLVGTLAH
jgi:hypothetical protein